MDQIDPRTHTIHKPIEGENLELERLAANRGCAFTPWESFVAVGVMLAVIVIGLWVWNAAQGVPA